MRTSVPWRLVWPSLALLGGLGLRGLPAVIGEGPPAAPAPPHAGPAAPEQPAPQTPGTPAIDGSAAPRASSPLLLGEFELGDDPVTDGDTFRLPAGAVAKSVRILGVDAEEIWHKGEEHDRAAAAEDFDAYCRSKRGDSRTPVKFGTPAGEAAKAFAKAFLTGVHSMRLERDEPGRDLDGHGRLLAHVFVEKEGKRLLFAEELIRAGLSPYFVKYGRSRRFDERLKAAQADAQEHKRGIFGDGVRHYPDYAERLPWWEARAKQVDAWRDDVRQAADPSSFVELGVAAETARFESLLGKTVTVFGSLDRIDAKGTPRRILLVDKPHESFPLVIFDGAVWAGIDLAPIESSFVRVTGTLSAYRGRMQLKIDDPKAISTK
jgi:endonuclease YncB( thermonuclease family)